MMIFQNSIKKLERFITFYAELKHNIFGTYKILIEYAIAFFVNNIF